MSVRALVEYKFCRELKKINKCKSILLLKKIFFNSMLKNDYNIQLKNYIKLIKCLNKKINKIKFKNITSCVNINIFMADSNNVVFFYVCLNICSVMNFMNPFDSVSKNSIIENFNNYKNKILFSIPISFIKFISGII